MEFMCTKYSIHHEDTCALTQSLPTADQKTIHQWNIALYIPERWLKEAVMGAPCCVLWMISSCYVCSLMTSPDAPLPESKLFKCKTMASALLAVTSVLQLIRGLMVESVFTTVPLPLFSPALLLSAVVLGRHLTSLERQKGVRTSLLLWLFWLSLTVVHLTTFFFQQDDQPNRDETVLSDVLNCMKFAVIVSHLVLYSVTDTSGSTPQPSGARKPCPDPEATLWARLNFTWVRDMLVKGQGEEFSESDVYDLLPGAQSCHVAARFARAWDQDVQRAAARNKSPTGKDNTGHSHKPEETVDTGNRGPNQARKRARGTQNTVTKATFNQDKNSPPPTENSSKMEDQHRIQTTMKDSTIKREDKVKGSEQKLDEERGTVGNGSAKMGSRSRARPSFLVALMRTFGVDFVLQQLCELANIALDFCDPLVLGLLLDHLEDRTAPLWKGYLICLLMVALNVTQTLLDVRTTFINNGFALRIKSAIVNSIFRKALRMDAESRQQTTMGQVVNQMSMDAAEISNTLCNAATQMWTAPLKIVIAMVLLYNLLGPSVLLSVALLVVMVPVNSVMTGRLSSQQTDLMDLKDERLEVFTEVINGIKIVKMNAWEPCFLKTVEEARGRELGVMWRKVFCHTAIHFYWHVAPHLVTLTMFSSYVYFSSEGGGYLSPSTLFVALSLLDILKDAMDSLPEVLGHLVKVMVSFRRVDDFLNRTDLQESVDTDVDADQAISIRNASFSWSSDTAPVLNSIDVGVKRGSLVAVVGPVGCGKSSLLSACLGHVNTLQGHVSVQGSIAYVPQQAWIQHATLRDNVLFGKALNKDMYQHCLDACALGADLEILPGGDLTEIGEKGVNLSGGQKQRVSLARAAYSQADLYLLDDPLSAVDSHVGAHIFHHVIGSQGLLAGKTRVLVTHGLQWLPLVDQIIVMTPGGRVSEMGSYQELLHRGDSNFARFLRQYGTRNSDHAHGVSGDMSDDKTDGNRAENDVDGSISEGENLHDESTDEDDEERSDEEENKGQANIKATLVEDDDEKVYYPTWNTLLDYCRALGGGWVALLLLLFALQQGAHRAADVALSHWSDHHHPDPDPDTDQAHCGDNVTWVQLTPTAAGFADDERLGLHRYYLCLYAALGVLHAVTSLTFKITQLLRQIHLAGIMHHRMLSRVLRAPMAFFDTTPVGRILHRFSNNLHVMDTELTETMEWLVIVVMGLAGKMVVLSYVAPVFLLLLPPIAVVVYFTKSWFIPSMRQLARLEFISEASCYSFFSETLGGATVIRAFGAQHRFVKEFERRVDLTLSSTFSWDCITRWVEVRLRWTGGVMVGVVVMSILHHRDTVTAGTAGLAVILALEITDSLEHVVLMLSWLSCELASVDRVTEYCNMPVEADWRRMDTAPSSSWPQMGEVRVIDLDLRYREGLDLVLKGVTFHVKAGEKVGIVGRTGAGKSSLTLALFRLVEPAGGKVIIDDLCTSDLGLHDLRSRLTILPQDPVIFAGSLRMNLDPFEHYTDAEVWRALRHAHLGDFVSALSDGLSHECGEGGENLSQGQRQLLCLSRALLHVQHSRVLVLDEATSAVDMATDHLVQDTLRSSPLFAHCTVLTIAHRLRTVLDYDKILVLESGEVVEYDSPCSLLNTPSSRFHGMASRAGLLPPR